MESQDMATSDIKASRWYAVYTRPSHERCVCEHLASRGIEYFLPTYRTTHRWKNRCTTELELPLFPTYVFVRILWDKHAQVLSVPSVISIVGSGRQPLPLPESEIDMLRSSLSLLNAQPHPYWNSGEWVRIKSGPLANMEGIVLREGKDLRFVLTIEQIMRSIVVDVDSWKLEPVPRELRLAK
jgi:transcription antitermination factor NusG